VTRDRDTSSTDGARTSGVIALDKAEAVAAKLTSVAKTSCAVVQSARASAGAVPAEVRNLAAAMADGADAFVARLRAGGMQMATAGGGGGGSSPTMGGLNAETLAEAAQAAKQAFKDKRAAQQAPQHSKLTSTHADAAQHISDVPDAVLRAVEARVQPRQVR
jgi:hypothetical protein